MMKMKRLTAIILAGAMCFASVGCGKKPTTTEGTTTENVEVSPHVTESTSEAEAATTELFVDDTVYAETPNADFEKFCMDYFIENVTGDSISYNFLVKDGSVYGIEPPPATMGDASMGTDAIEEVVKEDKEYIEKLKAFEPTSLTKEQCFTRDYLIDSFEKDLVLADHIYFYEPFAPMRGLQANLPTNFTDYRFDDKADVETYIALLNQMPEYFEEVLKFDREKAEKGFSMSDTSMDEVIEQCNTFIGDADSSHFMITVFNNRIDELTFLTDEEKEEFKKQDEEAVLNGMLPAFKLTADTFTELKGTGKNNGGICNFEGGKEYYDNYLLPKYVGSDKNGTEVKEMLESRFQNCMVSLYSTMMQSEEAYNYFIEKNGEIFTKEDGKTPKEIIDDLMKNYMGDFPEVGTIPYSVDYLDKSMETILDNVLAYYMSPAVDDLKGNIIYVNGQYDHGLWNTLAHEGCPGHMFQNTYYVATNPNPVRLLSNELGYMEGWAVYSSYQIISKYDFGTDYDDLLPAMYQANNEMGYILYGLVDVGVNYEGWDVEQVKSYMESLGLGSMGAEEIFNTVCGDPGAYLSYSAGYYEMLSQRERAEDALGSKFDPVEFHKVILDAGPCPYTLLSKRVDEYISSNQ